MRAVDTNVVVRFVVHDDPGQTAIANAVLAEPCFIPDTVLLETAWVLSSYYRVSRADLAATLSDIVNLPAVSVSDLDTVRWAIGRFAAGADFADMMHIAASEGTDCFATFDRVLAKHTEGGSPVPIDLLS